MASPPPPDPPVSGFQTVAGAADAAITYFLTKRDDQPDWYLVRLGPQEHPTTADTVEWAIRDQAAKRQRLRLEGLSVGLRAWDALGLTFQVEGLARP